ncbi:MAG: hypothetical protein GY870_16595 [archaeon]|nr:hypothetical protein [archaeon]
MLNLNNINEEYDGQSKTKKFLKKAIIAAGLGLTGYAAAKSGVFNAKKAKEILKAKEKESADALYKRASEMKNRTDKEAEKQKRYDVVDRQMKLKDLQKQETKYQKGLADERSAAEKRKADAKKAVAAEKIRKENERTGNVIRQTGGMKKWEPKKDKGPSGVFGTAADYWKKKLKDRL